ncbi:ABC transporter permease [Vagococcus jeotgali]|uniref:ABC transporter permease n=1 Tax=Vagococcus jeotgali TaxID=3109030 RepID=UPI002DD8FDAE|nr:ABC transporter permease [Vagococcus sp. B2T-5]
MTKLMRLFSLILVATFISFMLIYLSPIDPVQQYVIGQGSISAEQRLNIAERWGLNEPPIKQYLNWLHQAIRGNFGTSIVYRQPVINVIMERAGNTFLLMFISWMISGIIGYITGCLMAMKRNSMLDKLLKNICLILSSIPSYWVALLLLIIFSVKLAWFPIGFSSPIGSTSDNVTFLQVLHHLFLPTITLIIFSFPSIALHTRENLIGILNSDYVLFSKARGLTGWEIFKFHGVKSTLGAAFILQFMSFAELFGGSVLVETVFSYPGLGSTITTASIKSDAPLILGITVFSILFVFLGNLLADILSQKLDPRVKSSSKKGIE